MTAFNAVVAQGGGSIFIQSGTYTFNGAFNALGTNITVAAPPTNALGVLAVPENSVMFVGNHTITGAGNITFENITFQASSGVALSATRASSSSLSFTQCTISNSAGSVFSFTGTNSTSFLALETCNLIGTTSGASLSACTASLFNTVVDSGSAAALTLGATTSVTAQTCYFLSTSSNDVSITSASASMSSTNCSYIAASNSSCIDYTGVGSLISINDTYNSNAVSNYYATTSNSSAGSISLGNATLTGNAKQVNPILLATYFSSSNGSGIAWSDVSSSATVSIASGSFATAAITLTLPASPAEGATCAFVADTSGALVIQANTGQVIRVGNIVSGTTGNVTTTAQGDSLTLVYRTSGQRWIATQSMGNLTVT
jgi:hypothetical protein